MTLKPVLAFACAFALSGAAQPAMPRADFETGMWATTVEVVSIDAPAMPEGAQRQLRSMVEDAGSDVCAGGSTSNPLEDFKAGVVSGFASVAPGGSCRFEEDRMSEGRFSTVAACAGPNSPVASRTRIDGTYSPTRIDGDFSVVVSRVDAAPDAPALARVNARFTTRLNGPCEGASPRS